MAVKQKIYNLIPWMFVFLWMVLIFNLSAQPVEQSNSLSKGMAVKVVDTVNKVTPGPEWSIDGLNHLVRKNAHFFTYLVLAVLLLIALKKANPKRVLIAVGICVLYAISDELHQMFVPGRGPQLKDVFIDSAGAVVGAGVYQIANKVVSTGK